MGSFSLVLRVLTLRSATVAFRQLRLGLLSANLQPHFVHVATTAPAPWKVDHSKKEAHGKRGTIKQPLVSPLWRAKPPGLIRYLSLSISEHFIYSVKKIFVRKSSDI